MADQKVETIRGAYQIAVIATAALRSWGLNWLLLLQMDPTYKNGDMKAKAQAILPLIKGARDMIETGVDSVFAAHDFENTSEFSKVRVQAVQQIDACLVHFDMLAEKARDNTLDDKAILAAISNHLDLASDGMTRFLALLDRLVSQKEQKNIDDQHSIIRKAVVEMGKNNFTIGMIAINASVEAAHVGDAGRGFSVIANEIQTLSKNSKLAFDELSSRIK